MKFADQARFWLANAASYYANHFNEEILKAKLHPKLKLIFPA